MGSTPLIESVGEVGEGELKGCVQGIVVSKNKRKICADYWQCIFLLDIAALENNNFPSSIKILPQYIQYLLQRNAVMDIAA